MGRKSGHSKGDSGMGRSTNIGVAATMETEPLVRIVTGKFAKSTVERLQLLKAKRFVQMQQRESIEGLLQLAVQVGLEQLEKDIA